MRNNLILLTFFYSLIGLFSTGLQAFSFKEAVEIIKDHENVRSLKDFSKAKLEEGEAKGSWGDPMFKLAAKNFPKNSLNRDETPMTGIEFGVSQKIALTTKYGNIEDSYKEMSKSKEYDSERKAQELIKNFWHILISNKKLKEEITIIRENLRWINNILKVTKRLYSSGKTSQQAVLEIQIRKSELEASLSNKSFESKQLLDRLSYLLNKENDKIDEKTIPWNLLSLKNKENKANQEKKDLKELSLLSNVKAKEKMLTAQKQSYVPDVTVSVGYTKRSNIDNRGDFVSATVAFPLPFSGKKYASHSQASFQKAKAQNDFKNYLKYRDTESRFLINEVEKLESEISILVNKTIKYANNSRKITSKSYSLGGSSYIELLQSELKLQKLLLKKVHLNSLLSKNKVNYRFLVGEKLYE